MYTTKLPVTINHINYSDHLGHDQLISMLHETRVRFFKSLGVTELDFFGIGLVMKSLNINYRQEVFHGEELTFNLVINEIRGGGFSINHEVYNEEELLIADAQVVLLGFDYDIHKSVRLPEECKQKLNQYLHPIT